MGKKFAGGLIVLLLATGALLAQEPKLTLTAPPTGEAFLRGTPCTIRWTHSAYYDAHPSQHVLIYWGTDQIGTPVPATQDMYVWTAGKKSDGTWLPAGTKEITLESIDYDALDGPNIRVYYFVFKAEFLRKPLEFNKNPECPACFFFDPRLIDFEIEGWEWVRLELWKSGRKLADLGKFTGGRAQSGPVKIQLDSRVGLRETAVELRVFSDRGALLLKQKMESALTGR
jgi:hypothetical protein